MKFKYRSLASVIIGFSYLLIIVLAVGCSGSGTSTAASPAASQKTGEQTVLATMPAANTTTTIPPASAGGRDTSSHFSELLGFVPDSTDFKYATLIDFSLLRKNYNISLTDSMTAADYLNAMSVKYDGKIDIGSSLLGSGSFITGHGKFLLAFDFQKYLGYNGANIDAEIQCIPISTQNSPIIPVAAIGRFDLQTVDDVINKQEGWDSRAKSAYSSENYQGITIHSWGDGTVASLSSRLCPPNADAMGRTAPLAISQKHLYYAKSVSDVKSMIDSSQNKARGLADNASYVLVAKGLSDLGTYVGLIADVSQSPNDVPGKESLNDAQYQKVLGSQEPRLKKFTAIGTGLGTDDQGIYMSVTLAHTSADDAAKNVSLLKQRIDTTSSIFAGDVWNKHFPSTDIRVDGRVLLAKLYTVSPNAWATWFFNGDILFLHE